MKTKTLLLVATLLLSMGTHAAYGLRFTPTIPGTGVEDPTEESLVIEESPMGGEEAYYTLPSSSARDPTRGGYRHDPILNEWYPTLPSSGAQDYSRPGIKESDFEY